MPIDLRRVDARRRATRGGDGRAQHLDVVVGILQRPARRQRAPAAGQRRVDHAVGVLVDRRPELGAVARPAPRRRGRTACRSRRRRRTAWGHGVSRCRDSEDVVVHRLARLHGVGDLRVEEDGPVRHPARRLVHGGGHLGRHLRVRPPLVRRGRHRRGRDGDPVVPGHEFAGVALDGPYAGQRVAVDPAMPCGRCEYCRGGARQPVPRHRVRRARPASTAACRSDWSGRTSCCSRCRTRSAMTAAPSSSRSGWRSTRSGTRTCGRARRARRRRRPDRRPGRRGRTAGRRGAGLRQRAARAPAARPPSASAPTAPGRPRRPSTRRCGDRRSGRRRRGGDGGLGRGGRHRVACARPGARIALGGIPSTPLTAFPAAPARRKGLTFVMVRRMHETYPDAIRLATQRRRPRRAGERPVPARAGRRRVRARRPPYRRQDRRHRRQPLASAPWRERSPPTTRGPRTSSRCWAAISS